MTVREEVISRWRQLFERDYIKSQIKRITELYPEVSSITVSFHTLNAHDLIEPLSESPREVLDQGRDVLLEHILDLRMPDEPAVEPNSVVIRPIDGSIKLRISEIRRWHIEKLLEFEGLVRRCGEVRQVLAKVVYRCRRCEHEFTVDARDPVSPCPNCERMGPFVRVMERCSFVDSQRIIIQEPYETTEEGIREPKSIEVVVTNDIVDRVIPGERVKVVGILDLVPIRKDRDKQITEFKSRLDCLYIESLGSDYRDIEISPEDVVRIDELATDPDLINKLVRSVSPSIRGYDLVKLGILIQQVGGNSVEYNDGTTSRGYIHILLVGDPSVGKSFLLSFVSRLAPRCARATGSGASGVGATASAVREQEGWVLEAGVLPLASGGTAIIDEFDKLDDDDRAKLHEALEEGLIHIDKASVHAVLPARCSLLAAANPKMGRFDKYEPIANQIDLTPALLSRFDLIFAFVDQPDRGRDEEIAGHILGGAMYTEPPFDITFLRKYLAYARRLRPSMDDACREKIRSYYLSMRSSGSSSIPILPRALQTLRRLAEGCAKLRLSRVAGAQDAELAIQVYESAFKPLLTSERGEYDVDLIEIGISSADRDRTRAIMRIIQDLSQGGGAMLSLIVERAAEMEIAEMDVMKIIARLKRYGDIIEAPQGIFRPSHPM